MIEYNEYMNSEEWKNKREEILLRDMECRACGNQWYPHVHHLNYKNFGNENLNELIRLCKYCHIEEHEYIDSFNLTVNEFYEKIDDINKYFYEGKDRLYNNRFIISKNLEEIDKYLSYKPNIKDLMKMVKILRIKLNNISDIEFYNNYINRINIKFILLDLPFPNITKNLSLEMTLFVDIKKRKSSYELSRKKLIYNY